mgnify:CR=1 FL=1
MKEFLQNDLTPVIEEVANPRIGVITLSTDFTIEQDFRKICHNLPLDIFFNRIPFINPLTHENYLKMADHIPEITGFLFAYLNLLRDGRLEEWIYEEQALVAELGFRFAEKTSAIATVQALSPVLEHYPAKSLLVAPYLMEEFDESLI